MSVRAAALRRANRLNNRTLLKVERGDLVGAEVVVFESDDSAAEGSKVLIQGVERDELSEHHLQAALAHGSLIHSQPSGSTLPSSPSFKQAAAQPATKALPSYHIPTPDAGGIVRDYDKLYGPGNNRTSTWQQPVQYVKFSDKVEESSLGWGGLGYDMDDADLEWLGAFNAKEEGTSEGANGMASPATGSRSKAKGKDKEKDGVGALKISEDEFEYVMGMLELWTDRNVPMLHTNLSMMPAFTAVEPVFAATPSASFYPAYEVPRNVLPTSRNLVRIARNIFPHWKTRREQRKGHRIIPQLNFDETNDGDPYVCFRRRDVKVTRKTRQKDMLVLDRMRNVQSELLVATKIVSLVVEREKRKATALNVEKELWDARWNLFQVKRKNPQMPITAEEEAILYPERKQPQIPQAQQPSLQQYQQQQAALAAQSQLRRSRMSEREREEARLSGNANGSGMPRISKSRAQSPTANDRVPPEQLAALYAKRVDEEMRRKKEVDVAWEDTGNVGYHPMSLPAPERHFRPLPFGAGPTPRRMSARLLRADRSSSPESEEEGTFRSRFPTSFRLRCGRGGITRLDRRGPFACRSRRGQSSLEDAAPLFGEGKSKRRYHPFENVYDRLPRGRTTSPERFDISDEMDVDQSNNAGGDAAAPSDAHADAESLEAEERARIVDERWRYDSDMGLVGMGMGTEVEDQVVIDDYEAKYIRFRASLMKPEDLDILTAPTTALEKVRYLMSIPPEPGLPVTFLRQAPPAMGPPMSAQEQQQMLQRAQIQQQVAQIQRSQMQAQSQLKSAQGVPVPAGVASPMYPAQGGARPQVRRMVSNNGQPQVGTARPSQSPGPGMPNQPNQQPLQQNAQLAAQQMTNVQAVQLAQQRMQAQQQISAQLQNNPNQQAIQQAMIAARQQQQQQQQQQRAGQFMPNGQAMPLQGNGAAMPPPAAPRSASGNVQQLPNGDQMQVDSPRSNGRTPASGHLQLPPGQVALQADGSPVIANGMQRSPRQPLAQPNPMPNGYSLPLNFDQSGQLNPQQIEKVRAMLAGKANGAAFNQGQGLPNGAASNGFANGATPDNLPMKLTLPPARQNQLRAGGSPVNAQ